MQRFIYTFSWIIIVVGIGAIGYLAYTNLSHDFVYTNEENSSDPLLVYNDLPTTTVAVPDTTTPSETDSTTPTTPTTPATPTTTPSDKTIPEEYKELGDRINRLVTEYGGTMKEGSKGTRVGTVQEFLNIYEKKDRKAGIDNQYGPGTVASVKKFQEAQKMVADGQAGPTTFKAMLEYLKTL